RATAASVAAGATRQVFADDQQVSPAKLPRWRGFNLLEKFIAQNQKPFVEKDFAWMAEWGFDFVRLPLSYHCWSSPKDWKTLREQDPNRLVIADGLNYGTVPVPGLADLKVGQSARGYDPFQFTHYRANWAKGSDKWPEPTWPYTDPGGKRWDKEALRRNRVPK